MGIVRMGAFDSLYRVYQSVQLLAECTLPGLYTHCCHFVISYRRSLHRREIHADLPGILPHLGC